jgi:hypothetical protein
MQIIKSIHSSVQTAWYKAGVFMMAMLGVLLAAPAHAISKTDLTTDTAGGKKFADIAGNIDDAAQTGATLFIQLVSIGGFIVVAISLYTLWAASKDEREKPLSAIVGLFIGGAMAAVGTIMWIMKNTVVG